MPAGRDMLEGFFVGSQDQFINSFLLGRKAAADRKGAGDVAGVAINFTAGVYQHQVAILEQRVVLTVVQDASVLSGRDDGTVSRHLRSAFAELVIQLGFEMVFVESSTAGLHGTDMGARGDFRSVLHHLYFVRRLV